MKNKELIENLSGLNPEAEVGYEYSTIARVHNDSSGKYIDLSGERCIDPDIINDTGIFIVVTDYIKLVGGDEDGSVSTYKGTEINAVYRTRESAEKIGEWLIKRGECNGIRYTNYRIENFLIID